MRLPLSGEIVFSSLLPSLREYGGLPVQRDDAAAAGHLRSYQRARCRSYAERGMRKWMGPQWDQYHFPFDPLSYHLIAHEQGLFRHAQQIRYFGLGSRCHERLLDLFHRLEMLGQAQIDGLLKSLERYAGSTFAQVGGWVARSSDSGHHAAYLPYFCWGLQRILGVHFSYAVSRVENGAARFLLRMGAFPLTEAFSSPFYAGQVQILGFDAYEVNQRHRPLVIQAEESLRERLQVVEGTHSRDDTDCERVLESVNVLPGGRVVFGKTT